MAALTGAALAAAAREGVESLYALLNSRARELGGKLVQVNLTCSSVGRMHVAALRAREGLPERSMAATKNRKSISPDEVRVVQPRGATGGGTYEHLPSTIGEVLKFEALVKGEEVKEKKKDDGTWLAEWVVVMPSEPCTEYVYLDEGWVKERGFVTRPSFGHVSLPMPYRYGLGLEGELGARPDVPLESGGRLRCLNGDPLWGTVWLGPQISDHDPNRSNVVSPGLGSIAASMHTHVDLLQRVGVLGGLTIGRQEEQTQMRNDLYAQFFEGIFEAMSKLPRLKEHPYPELLAADVGVPMPGWVKPNWGVMDGHLGRGIKRALQTMADEIAMRRRQVMEHERLIKNITAEAEAKAKALAKLEAEKDKPIPTIREQLERLKEKGEIAAWSASQDEIMFLVEGMKLTVTPEDVRLWASQRGMTGWGEREQAERSGRYVCPPWLAVIPILDPSSTKIFGFRKNGTRGSHAHPHAGNGGETGYPCWGDAGPQQLVAQPLGMGDLATVVRNLKAFMGTVNYEHGYSPPWDWATFVEPLPGVKRPEVKVKVVKKAKVRVIREPVEDPAPPTAREGDDEDDDEDWGDDEDF